MTDLEKVAELTKALQEGKTLVCIDDKRYTYKNVDGYLVEFFNEERHCFNPSIIINNCKIQEPEFEITENQLAEYECRDGSKAVCWGDGRNSPIEDGSRKYSFPFIALYNSGQAISINEEGRVNHIDDHPKDLIRKIRDL